MNYQVTVIEKEYKKRINEWLTADIYHIVIESETHNSARKAVRKVYPHVKQFRFGRITKTDKNVGQYPIEEKGFKTIPSSLEEIAEISSLMRPGTLKASVDGKTLLNTT